MDIIAAFTAIFIALLFCIYKGLFILYPMLFGLVLFTLVSLRRGFGIKDLLRMMLKGSKKSLTVIRIFVLIGAITAVWRASGTISFIVYYGIKFMNPHYFVLSAFILCSIVSFLLGTSFGTVGTMGVVLMVMAKTGNVNINVLAGAVIAGAYFGDRCSPMSSSASLVAAVTETELYKNIRNMLKTSLLPFAVSVLLYILLSRTNPLVFHGSQIGDEILKHFNIHWAAILPALSILLLAAFRVDVKLSMGISILLGAIIGIAVQGDTWLQMLRYILVGYTMEGSGFFAEIIKGGGIYSMLKVGIIVFISSAYSGIFEGTQILKEVEGFIEKSAEKIGVFATTLLTSIATASFACNQALAVILTAQLEKKMYEKKKLDKYTLALDIENTAILIAAAIPWNIAGAVPAAALTADAGFIPYAYYLYVVPLMTLLLRAIKKNPHLYKSR